MGGLAIDAVELEMNKFIYYFLRNGSIKKTILVLWVVPQHHAVFFTLNHTCITSEIQQGQGRQDWETGKNRYDKTQSKVRQEQRRKKVVVGFGSGVWFE